MGNVNSYDNEDEDEDFETADEDSDPGQLPIIPTAAAPTNIPTPAPSAPRSPLKIPTIAPPKPIEQLTPEELRDFVRGKINEKYNKPVDYDAPVKEAKEAADKSTFWSHVGEAMSGLGDAKAKALGVGTDRSASWASLRKGFGDKATDAVANREKAKAQDAAGRLKDSGSPESQRAREAYAQLYKSAYGGTLPEGYSELSAEALTGGVKTVQSMLKDIRDREKMINGNAVADAGNQMRGIVATANLEGADNRQDKGITANAETVNKQIGSKEGMQKSRLKQQAGQFDEGKIEKLGKEISGTQDSVKAIDEVEKELGFKLEDAVTENGKLVVKGKPVDLPGVNVPGLGRMTLLDDKAQKLKAAAGKIFNTTLKDRSGSAVTSNELDRLKEEFETGKFNTEAQLVDGLQRYKRAVAATLQNRALSFDPALVKEYSERGGRVSLDPQTEPENKAAKTPDLLHGSDLP